MSNNCFPTKNILINNKLRQITLYGPEELKKQRNIYDLIKPVLIQNTHESVYSYIPGKSNWTAVNHIKGKVAGYKYFVMCDISDFFPSISRKLAKEKLSKILSSKLVEEIGMYVCCSSSGIAEGSPLSPAISNVFLHDFDDKIFNLPNIFYLRFCDDLLLLTNTDPNKLLLVVENELSKLKLTINPLKSLIGLIESGFDFLGFTISKSQITVTKEKVINIIAKIANEKNRKKRKQIIGGWWSYCRSEKYLPGIPESILLLSYTKNIIKTASFIRNYKTAIISDDQYEIRKAFSYSLNFIGIMGLWLLSFSKVRKTA